jgi:FO synthase
VLRSELLERIRKAVDAEPLGREAAVAIATEIEREPTGLLEPLLEAGRELGIRGHGHSVTVSLNVFIPLTNLCRNRCAYCTFAKGIQSEEAHTYLLDEVG